MNVLSIDIGTGQTILSNWLIIGPFHFKAEDIDSRNPASRQNGLNHDYLADRLCPEPRCDHLADVLTTGTQSSYQSYYSDTGVIPFDHIYPALPYAVAYAYTTFDSATAADEVLAVGSGDGVKLWMNGAEIFHTSNTLVRAAFPNTDLIPIHIRKGRNVLLAKVDHKTDDWALILDVLSPSKARRVALQALDGALLQRRIIPVGGSLSLSWPPLALGYLMSFRITDGTGRNVESIVLSGTQSGAIQLRGLKEGYYKIHFSIDDASGTDSFYYGPLYKIADTLRHLRASASNPESQSADAALRRYLVLRRSDYYNPNDADWQKKMLSVGAQAVEMFRCHDVRKCQGSGFVFREYRSRIDGSVQYYLYYRPSSAFSSLPLVVVVPYAEDPQRPFLESSLIAWPDDLAALSRAAETSHIAVAIANGRGTIGDAPLGEADILEMLDDLEHQDSNIDRTRIYLYGVCEGGRRALLLAEHNPGKFAAVGTYGPILAQYHGVSEAEQWLQKRCVIALAYNLSNTPVVLLVGDLDAEEQQGLVNHFVHSVRSSGGLVDYTSVHGGMHKEHGLEEAIFPRLVRFQLDSRPEKINFVYSGMGDGHAFWLKIEKEAYQRELVPTIDVNRNGDTLNVRAAEITEINIDATQLAWSNGKAVTVNWNGVHLVNEVRRHHLILTAPDAVREPTPQPLISQVFAHPFLIVLGGYGNEGETIAKKGILARWRSDFYGSCPTVNDRDLTISRARHRNLVFIGIPAEDTYSRRIYDGLSLPTSNGSAQPDFAEAFLDPLRKGLSDLVVHASQNYWLMQDTDLAIVGWTTYMQWPRQSEISLHSATTGHDALMGQVKKRP